MHSVRLGTVVHKQGFPPAGDEFGALRLPSLGSLYGDQARAAKEIIREVHKIACEGFIRRAGQHQRVDRRDARLDAPIGSDPSDFHRPHHAYVINGKRGTGKTSVLLTLHPYLTAMRLGGESMQISAAEKPVMDDLVGLRLTGPAGARGERVALVLPIVFTEDMELQETTMEAIFALLEHEIDEALLRTQHDHDQRGVLSRLRDDLRTKVGVSWTYSRKIGAETLTNDALDYADFVARRADLNRSAYTKIITWRRFLDRYLDALGYQILILLFDDSDLNPAIAEDMVRTVRMYLSHPRAVSVVAVDLETLRSTLFSRNVVQHQIILAPSAGVEESTLDALREDMVALEYENTEHLIDKVLPRPNRHRLAMADLQHLNHFFSVTDALHNEDTFGAFCRQQFSATANHTERLTWWFLYGPYRRMVAGDLRSIVSFRRQVQGGAKPLEALFNRHGLSALLERTDGSLNLLAELVEGGEYDDASPGGTLDEEEVRFIDLTLDVKIASEGLDAGPSGVVATWLPTAELTGQRHEFAEEGEALGVLNYVRGALAPRNCLYIHQFRHIQKALEDILPNPTPFANWLSTIDPGSADLQSVREVVSRLLDAVAAGSDERTVLSRPLFSVRNVFRGPRVSGSADPEEVFKAGAAEALVALAVAATAPVPRSKSKAATNAAIRKALEELSDVDADADALDDILARICEGVSGFERRRQEALFIWACANEIVALGDDMTSLKVRHAPRMLAQSMAGPSPAGNVSRLASLVRATVERADGKGPRNRLLHAWSLLPVLDVIYDYGADYLPSLEPKKSWASLAKFIETAIEPFPADPGSWEGGNWVFPDLPRDMVALLITETREGALKLHRDLKAFDPAGSITFEPAPEAFWRQKPTRRIAALLGTSERWVTKNLAL